MDTVDLNNSPDLTMEQITKLLFNNELLSDIQFHIGDKVVFAHSWELMKRSIVFREQFRGNLGENKLITIEDVTYDALLQFLRFIYTDDFDVHQSTVCDMLKLAKRYKIIKLETNLLNLDWTYDRSLMTFEYGSTNKYELFNNCLVHRILHLSNELIDNSTFLQIDSKILEEILKSNQMPSSITEVNLYDFLVRWMNRSCEINQILDWQRRSHFDKLLRLIRFPTMSQNEFFQCVKNHPDLLTDHDISTICKQFALREQPEFTKWSAEPRLNYSTPYEKHKCSSLDQWVSKFTVSDKLILHGLRCGSGYSDFEIEITANEGITKNRDVLGFKFVDSVRIYNTISLGESIKLKPNVEYTIEIKNNKHNSPEVIFCRKSNVNLVVTGPSDLVMFTDTSKVLFEIFFKLPDN